MKYFFSLLLSFFLVTLATAQDFKKVQTVLLLGKIEEAKTEIDKSLTDVKLQSKPEGWYWKARINAAIYKNEALRAKYPNAFTDADAAFKKYLELDPTYVQVKEKGADGFFDMYATAFNAGINNFKEKKWPAAAVDFETAVLYSDYIFKNKWANSASPFDTTSILYAAYAYQNAQKPDLAQKFYSRLAEYKVTGEGFADIYKFLVDQNIKSKNKEGFDKYLALGKEVYPKENWEDFEIEFIDLNYTLDQKKEFYEKGDIAGTLSENMYLQFGDVFVNVKNKEGVDSTLHEPYTKRAIDAFKKAFGKNPQNALAAYNAGVIYYNYFNLEDDKYAENIKKLQLLNTNKVVEKDPKKKIAAESKHKEATDAIKKVNADIEKKALEYVDVATDWLTKSFLILKDKSTRNNTEKSVINKSVDFLANLYYYKMNRLRAKDPKGFDAAEVKYKEYDALHATFK